MSDSQRPRPPVDGGGFRLQLDDERLRIDDPDLTIDLPLAMVEHCVVTEVAGQELFDLRMCVEIKVSEVVMRHRRNPSRSNAVRRAWEAARRRVASAAADSSDDASEEDSPAPAIEAAQTEAADELEAVASSAESVPPIGGPALLAGGVEWLIFEPLADTRLLSVAELLVHEDHQGA